MIIALNGYANSGKDTVGLIIQYLLSQEGKQSIEDVIKDPIENGWWLEESSGWEIKKFGGKLKDIASHLTGIDVELFENQEFKKSYLGPEWSIHGMPITVREFLQKLGTDSLRNNLNSNVWVNALFSDYLLENGEYPYSETNYPNWIITDCRFLNEARVIKDKGGIIIRIDRPGVKPINNHPSEIELDDWKFDYKIANVSDIYELKVNVENILKHAKIIR